MKLCRELLLFTLFPAAYGVLAIAMAIRVLEELARRSGRRIA